MDNHQISADPWVEWVGVLRNIFCDESHVRVEIANKLLSFRQISAESDIILNNLSKNMIGRKIGILFTDLPNKPIAIRTVSMHDPPKVAPAEIRFGKKSNPAAPNCHCPACQIHAGKDRVCQKQIDENLNGVREDPKKNSTVGTTIR